MADEPKENEDYISTLQLIRGGTPKDQFWKYFFKVDFKDHWNWICLAAAIFLFWWSFKMISAAFV